MARARFSHETTFPSLSYWKFRYHTQRKQETIPHPIIQSHIPSYQFNQQLLSLVLCQYKAYFLSLATAAQHVSFIFGDSQRNLATTTQRVSFIFGDGQRTLATACATRIFYLW